MKSKKQKEIKGFMYRDGIEKGWQGNHCALFLYRRVEKSETWFVPVVVKIVERKSKRLTHHP